MSTETVAAGLGDAARLAPLVKPLGITAVVVVLLAFVLPRISGPLTRFFDRMRAARTDRKRAEDIADGESFFPEEDPEKRLLAILGEATGVQVTIDPHAAEAKPPAKLGLPLPIGNTKVEYLNGTSRLAREKRPGADDLLVGLGATPEEVMV